MRNNISYTKLTIRCLLSFIFIIISPYSFSQIFEFEQSPPSVKWEQINTPLFKLIYPEELNADAQAMANLLDTTIHTLNYSIGTNPRKIPIILHNRGVESNGFVQLAPRRSELFTTPPQHADPAPWLYTLPIHEYRHVVQMDKLTGSIRPPFELVGMAFFGIALPSWFYEGDAVGMETLLTPAGRGRLPSWEMAMRTNALSGKTFTYAKNYLGSLKDITPGYYQLGYFMNTKIRRDYGPGILDSILTRMSKNPLRPYNFSSSLKHYTGFNTRQWHHQTLLELQQKWKAQIAASQPINYPELALTDTTIWTDFLFPQAVVGDTLIALRQTPLSVNDIVILSPSGIVKEVFKTGMQTYPNFSYSSGKITWDEIRYDKRFHKRSFNVINLYDIRHKKYKQLTHKTRLFSPVLSHDGSKIAAVEIDLGNRVSLIVLDAVTGHEITRIPSPKNALLQTPSFHPTGKKIIATEIANQGAGIIEFNLIDSSTTILLAPTYQQIERPIYVNDHIIYKAHCNGIDNIYSLQPQTKEIFQLSNAPFGAFNPSYDHSSTTLWFNNYQPYGYQISQIQLDNSSPQPLDEVDNTFIDYFKPLLAREKPIINTDSINEKKFPTSPYNELSNLFNFHSVSIGSDDFHSVGDLKLGALLLSDNLLNTLSVRIGAAYDQTIHRPEYTASLSYRRFLPIFNLEYRNSGVLSGIKLKPNDPTFTSVRWRENVFKASVQIPLRFNRMNQIYQTGFTIGSSYTHRYQLNVPELQDRFIENLEFPLSYGFYFNKNTRKSLWDLAPKWGQNLSLNLHHFPFGKQSEGKAFTLKSTFYFPGLFSNHSIRAQFNYQYHDGSFLYTNAIPMVNGYDQLQASQPANTFLVDYRFPIAYPDWTIGPIAYIRRVKGGLFYNVEDLGTAPHFHPRTLGVEIRADLNLLRFFLPIVDVGAKAIYVNEPSEKKWIWQLGFSYSY